MEETIKTETLAITEIQPQPTKQEKNAKRKQTLIVVTYVVALLCLLAGLLVPLFDFRNLSEDLTNNMMIKYVPAMFNDLYKFFAGDILLKELPWFAAELPNTVTSVGGFPFDSLIGLLYTVMCVFGLFMLIPVCAGKKTKNTSANAALIVEILTIVFVAAYICFHTYTLINQEGSELGWDNFNFLSQSAARF
ncbi:MAG: hypothetical protein K2N47_02590 [Clostridia bacterium]|nr:hypothetical protein [Clostridia bacterium]